MSEPLKHRCSACKAEIVWMKSVTGKWVPVDAGSIKSDEALFNPKKMTAHFATCSFADTFRKKRSKNA